MNFETVLFAAAFLLLAILTLPRGDTPPSDAVGIEEIGTPLAPGAALTSDDLSAEKKPDTAAEITAVEISDTQVEK